jgi:hypothetical protein
LENEHYGQSSLCSFSWQHRQSPERDKERGRARPRKSGFRKDHPQNPRGLGRSDYRVLKKLGLANADGSPNDVYKKFRNPSSSGAAIASAIRHAYAPLYKRNEFMHELGDSDLLGLIVEETGQSHDSPAVKLTLSCIKHLKAFANFGAKPEQEQATVGGSDQPTSSKPPAPLHPPERKTVGLNLGYTINLNLPATSDPEVFDAIFKSLKEHLLRDDDA